MTAVLGEIGATDAKSVAGRAAIVATGAEMAADRVKIIADRVKVTADRHSLLSQPAGDTLQSVGMISPR